MIFVRSKYRPPTPFPSNIPIITPVCKQINQPLNYRTCSVSRLIAQYINNKMSVTYLNFPPLQYCWPFHFRLGHGGILRQSPHKNCGNSTFFQLPLDSLFPSHSIPQLYHIIELVSLKVVTTHFGGSPWPCPLSPGPLYLSYPLLPQFSICRKRKQCHIILGFLGAPSHTTTVWHCTGCQHKPLNSQFYHFFNCVYTGWQLYFKPHAYVGSLSMRHIRFISVGSWPLKCIEPGELNAGLFSFFWIGAFKRLNTIGEVCIRRPPTFWYCWGAGVSSHWL